MGQVQGEMAEEGKRLRLESTNCELTVCRQEEDEIGDVRSQKPQLAGLGVRFSFCVFGEQASCICGRISSYLIVAL